MKFGEKVRVLRTDANITQEALGKDIGVSIRTIIAYEKGETYPRKREIYKKLAELFKVDINYLMTEDEEFISEATELYGRKGEIQAKNILAQASALFAGGDLSDEDQLAFLHEMQAIYFDSKKRAQKFTPKKYRKNNE